MTDQLSYDKLNERIEMFQCYFRDKSPEMIPGPEAIASSILQMIDESMGAEDFDSIRDTLPRDLLFDRIEIKVKEVHRYIRNTENMEELYFEYVWERLPDAPDSYEEVEEKGYPYDHKIFLEAFLHVKEREPSLYITNWQRPEYQEKIWKHYTQLADIGTAQP